jgi:diadenosine tetraphosphate (Ap4A) HIT family hydrolase
MHPERTACAFCAQIAGRREHNALASLLGSGWSQRPLLVETEMSVAMPSIGALAPGHVLVSPKRHVRSAAMCGGSDLLQ